MSLSENKDSFNYIYGPVYSWRMGASLGVDPLAKEEKICNLDCAYCDLGPTQTLINERKTYIDPLDLIDELKQIQKIDFDTVTFSGRGEPTLAANLGVLIDAVRHACSQPVAVVTNASLFDDPQVRKDCAKADIVCAKLDAYEQQPDDVFPGALFNKTVQSLKQFRKEFKGKLSVQILFSEKHKDSIQILADSVARIEADEVHIDMPYRKEPEKFLTFNEVSDLRRCFKGVKAVSVYEVDLDQVIAAARSKNTQRHGKQL